MNHTIRGSDVFVKEDLRAQLAALELAAGGYPAGEFRRGFAAALAAVRASIGLPAGNDGAQLERCSEVIDLRIERTMERYTPPPATLPPATPERRFAIRGEREEWPGFEQEAALTRSAPAAVATQRRQMVDQSGDSVNLATFWQRKGELRERQEGYVWVGDDGYTAFWSKADWQQVAAAELCAWGDPVSDEHWALVRHEYANRKRAEAAGRVRVLPRERGFLR